MEIIPNEFIKEIEKKTGIKMQFSQLADISGATKQLINQYKNKPLPQIYSEKIVAYFSKYELDKSTQDIDIATLKNIIESIEEYLEEQSLILIPSKKAELISIIYQMYIEGNLKDVTRDNVINFCKIAS